MPVVHEQSARVVSTDPLRAQWLRRRIRSRYPILKDGVLPLGQLADLPSPWAIHWPGRALTSNRQTVTPPSRTSEMQPRSPASLRMRLKRIDESSVSRSDSRNASLVLQEVGPQRIFAYWGLSDSVLAPARAQLGEVGVLARTVLRLFDLGSADAPRALQPSRFEDVEVDVSAGRTYLDAMRPDCRYVASLGLLAPDGRFLALCRSRSVLLPRDAAGDHAQERWMHGESFAANEGAIWVPPVTPALLHAVQGEGQMDWPLRDIRAEAQVVSLYRRFLVEGPRALRHAPSIQRRSEQILRQEFRQRQDASRVEKTSPVKRPETTPSRRSEIFLTRLDDSSRQNAHRHHPKPSLDYPPAPQTAFDDRLRQTRMDGLAPAIAASRNPRLSFPASVASRSHLQMGDAKRLIRSLEAAGVTLEAELILRGRVEPGKRVRIGGRIIETDPAGRFCVSCVLRDGKLHVPVEAVEAEVVIARRDVRVDMGVSG